MIATGGTPLLNTIFCAYVAVGIFFFLSGFILALNYPLDQPWSIELRVKFAVARFSRVYPVYIGSMLLVAPFVIGSAFGGNSQSALIRRLASAFLNIFMIQAWVPPAALSWNGPGWSLSAEAFFYLCFPFLGIFLFRIRTLWKAVAVTAILWALALVIPAATVIRQSPGFGNAVATSNVDSLLANFTKFNPLLNLPVFLAGIMGCRIYLLLKKSVFLTGKGYLFYIPGFAILLTLAIHGNRIPYPLMHGGLALPAAMGIVLGLALGDRYLCALLSNRLLVFLGKASYAEYLLHLPIRLGFSALKVQWSPMEQCVYFVTVLAASALVFHFYEEPLQRYLRTALRRHSARHAAAA